MPLQDFLKEFPECKDDPVKACYSELLKFMMLEMAAQMREAEAKLKRIKQIKIVLFHDRTKYDAALSNAFNGMMSDASFHEKYLFSTISPLGWENSIPLQAADLIAYENFKDSEASLVGRKRRTTLRLLLEMIESFGGRARRFTPETIHDLRNAVNAIK